MATATEEFESDDTPSVITRTHSAVWKPPPSAIIHRGSGLGSDSPPPQDFSALGIMEAQRQAAEIHRHSLVTVLYNIMKASNALDLKTIADNDIAQLVVNYQREGSRWTFLMQAAYWNNENVARWLFTHGADPYVRNASNQTALDVALAERHMNVAEIVRIKMQEINYKQHAERKANASKPQNINSPRRH